MPRPGWKPTHMVRVGRRTFGVMLDPAASGDGPAYTWEEWDTSAVADWSRRGGEWLFQGAPRGGSRVQSVIEARRTKPRASIVLSPEEREAADHLAATRGLSLSTLLGQLVRAEAERERRRSR